MCFPPFRRNTPGWSNRHRQGWTQAMNLDYLCWGIVQTAPGMQLGTIRSTHSPAIISNTQAGVGQTVLESIGVASLTYLVSRPKIGPYLLLKFQCSYNHKGFASPGERRILTSLSSRCVKTFQTRLCQTGQGFGQKGWIVPPDFVSTKLIKKWK